ncbi:MAG: hypothetical protein K9M54_05390 [Kiritimatiellales bacterium]|nr:hypothetical protein [Kiritimatiellales bacterium]
MNAKKTGVVLLATVMTAIAAQAALFTQDFSSSTNAGDYVDATTPTANQFTVINGGATSIDAGRLKLVNAAGTGGNVQRWVDMAGTPVGAMSFSYDLDLTFSESNNVRLFTGTIGQPNAGNHWMAWGVDATGTDNEWKVSGTSDVFTGPQTMTFFLNDSGVAINYTDPAAGTQLLATNSYDVWVGTTLVADGKTDAFVQTEKNLTAFNFGIQNASACTYYFDNIEVLEIPADPVLIVYQDDFSGAATNLAKTTVPEINLPGFSAASASTGLDGSGRLEATTVTANANYRFRIDTDPLTADTSITEIKYTAVMRTPPTATTEWVMIGFQQININGLLTTSANAGPMVQFNPNGTVILRGGTYSGTTNGNISAAMPGGFSGGDVITAEMTYHVDAGTMDLAINGSTVTNGFALEHEFPVGTLSDPVVWWTQIQLRNQQTAANGGAYIDSFQIETTTPLPVPVLGYAGWAAGWGVDLSNPNGDFDNDGLLNIYEYGLGGNPTNVLDQGTSPVFGTVDVGGTNYFGYVYPQLSDPNSGLSYSLAITTDLVFPNWVTNSGYLVYGTNVTGNALDEVTNITTTVENQKFIRLIIE